MITKIEVNGFKSLSDFELKLNKGLNILVGPNGAGKTNIILFFEFLSQMVKNPITKAISSVGGAGTIFKKIGEDSYQNNISFKIYGSGRLTSKKFVVYEYNSTIKTSFEKDTIFFSNQRIKIRTSTKFWADPAVKFYKTNWDLDIEYNNDESGNEIVTIQKMNKSKVNIRFYFGEREGSDDSETIKKFILNQNPNSNLFIYSLYFFTDFAKGILNDLVGGETFNIIPSKVKELEDAASPPEIKRDGSGLATTLYAMKKSKGVDQKKMSIFFGPSQPERDFKPETFQKVKSYLRLANNTISDLDIQNDPFDNKLVVKIIIHTGSYKAALPLSAMSDGTIKWLSLITAILTSETIFSIEEP